jgi:uncharacterized membrane-anchored protein
MKIKLIVLSTLLALQCSWILATAVVQERGIAKGSVVLLETRPVDPRDLLRGDYVILEYAINSVPRDKFSPATGTNVAAGQPVWVALEQQGEFHQVAMASFQPIGPNENRPVLRGTTSHSWRDARPSNSVRVEYDLERYYVPEGTGNPRGKLTVEVAVPKSGRGLIRQVFVDGKPYAEAMRSQSRQ